MGNWQLEVFKMAVYIAFPVTLFHYFNSPGNIDENLSALRLDLIGDPNADEKDKAFKLQLQEITSRQLSK